MHSTFGYLCLFLSLPNAYSLVLQPVVPTTGDSSLSKRAALSALDLQNSTHLYWGATGAANSNAVLANFTIYTPDDDENILSLENFDSMLSSINCSDNAMQLTFKDDDALDYAQRAWDPVNKNGNHSFVMVAGQGHCGSNTDRQPFQVNSVVYDTTGRTAHLQGAAQNWTQAAHTYDMHVGHVTIPGSGVSRRDYTKDWSVDFAHEFTGSIKLSKGGFGIGLDSSGSNTAGEFDFELDIKTTLGIPHDATAKIQPKGVSATAKVTLSVSGDLPDTKFGKSITVLSIPLDGLEIPGGILDIGPNLDINLGLTVGPLSGSASVTGGATVTIPDDAVLEIDLLDPSNNQFSGWNPSASILPWSANAKIAGSVQVFAEPDLDLKAEILDHGYQIGFGLKMPYVNAELDGIVSPTGACASNPLPHHIYGVQISSAIGAQLQLDASKVNDVGDPLFSVSLANYNHTFTPMCFDFGPTVGSGNSTTTGSPSNGTSTLSPPKGTSSALPTNGTSVVPVTSAPMSSPTSSSSAPSSTTATNATSNVKTPRRVTFGRFGNVLEA